MDMTNKPDNRLLTDSPANHRAHELISNRSGLNHRVARPGVFHFREHIPEVALSNDALTPNDFKHKRRAAELGLWGFNKETVDRLEIAARATYPALWMAHDKENNK